MPTFGLRPDDFVRDSRGDIQIDLKQTFYATRADAEAQANPLGTATSGKDGRWQFTSDASGVFGRDPEGNIRFYDSEEPKVTTTAARPATLAAKRGHMPRIVSLIAGTEDEVPVMSNGTAAVDTVNWKVGGQGWKVTGSTSGFTTFSLDPIPTADPFVAGPVQAVCAWVYVPDATKITDLTFYLYHDEALTSGQRWGKGSTQNPTQTIVNGWNFFRIAPDFSTSMKATVDAVNWGTINRVSVVASTNAAAVEFTIGHVYLEVPEKAKLLLVADRGYKSFYDYGYPQMKALGVPVTWAVDCTLFGSQAGTINEAITEAQLHALSKENGNSVSLHGWDGSATSAMTAAQARADSMKGIRWLQRFGYEGRMWRAAWVQQAATNAAAAKNLFIGLATSTGKVNPIPWPAIDITEIPRNTVDRSITTTQIDARFAWLKKTRMMEVCFIHRVNTDATDSFGADKSLWDYYVSKVQQGISEGWLEGVTFEQLYYDMGGTFSTSAGATVARYTDSAGTVVTKNVL